MICNMKRRERKTVLAFFLIQCYTVGYQRIYALKYREERFMKRKIMALVLSMEMTASVLRHRRRRFRQEVGEPGSCRQHTGRK